MAEKKDLPTSDRVATGTPNYDGTFNDHVLKGNFHGTQINGLHCLSQMIAEGKAIARANLVADARYPGIYLADVTISGATKHGSFFPDNWSIDQVKTAVTAAWRDWKTFGTGPSSGIYKGLASKYGLSWAGLAPLRTPAGTEQKIWIGARGSGEGDKPIITAFPAVNNRFF